MTDDDILTAASEIIAKRSTVALLAQVAETERLFKTFAAKRHKEPHNIGKPVKLTQIEALLLVALERNRYIVECDSHGGKWSGDALCKYHTREGAMSFGLPCRHDVLLALWASVSGQDNKGATITLTEDHLRGSVVRQQIHELYRELREQEAEPEELDLAA